MRQNVGKADRIIRLVLGLVLIVAPLAGVAGIWAGGLFTYVTVAVGLVLVATAGMKFCPLYRLAGFSTCPR